MAETSCPSCRRAVNAVEGLCPLCGTLLPRPGEALPDVTDPRGDALPDFDDPDAAHLMDGPPDTDPTATIPPEIFDGEDTDPGAGAPAHEPDPAPAAGGERSPAAKKKPEAEGRRLPRLPWDRLVVVALYLVIGGALLAWEHNTSEAVRIDRHLTAADRLLGERQGAGATVEALIEAAEHYLEALALDVQIDLAHRRLDLIKRRLEERRTQLPEDMARRHAALSSRAQMERAQTRRGLFIDMPVSVGERFGLDAHRSRMRRNQYIYFFGFVFLLGWLFLRGTWKRMSSREMSAPREGSDDTALR